MCVLGCKVRLIMVKTTWGNPASSAALFYYSLSMWFPASAAQLSAKHHGSGEASSDKATTWTYWMDIQQCPHDSILSSCLPGFIRMILTLGRIGIPSPIWVSKGCYSKVPQTGSDSTESACNAGDLGSIPRLGRSPGEGKGYPFQYSGLENSMDCIVHGVAKSQTLLIDFHIHKLGDLK